ncbi:Transmembrane protein ENSP00000343375-like [Cricetulus griseus]|uniref:Transmembrane protein ENSP00000343375-like n=1 Tax=Cricetulus griseus TaxID=10029 RepID=G3I8N6_CRIGR|nr:Transmembrane protein ENSP00000343375-like [Cricetulus griseus]
MATEEREVMETRGAGESCPTLSKVPPGDNIPEGKSKAALDAEPPKLELPILEENETCEDKDCPGPPKSMSPKSGPTTKGQAGDGPGPEPMELPLTLETEHHNAMELEKFSGGLQDLLLPQNQFAMFLYCFIFIHIVYVAKEMVFFLFSKHYLFCLAAILLCLIKTLWSYFQVPLLLPSLAMSSVHHQTPPLPLQPCSMAQLPASC